MQLRLHARLSGAARLAGCARHSHPASEKFSAFNTIQKPLIDPTTGMEDPSGAMVDVKVKYYALTNYSGVPVSLKDKFAERAVMPPRRFGLV